LGYWKRTIKFPETNDEKLSNFFYCTNAPKVTYLIPSYKEDIRIIKQTLLSAALQEYPNKNVVLLKEISSISEVEIVADLFVKVAIWFKEQAEEYNPQDHAEELMIEKFFLNQYESLIQIADSLKKHENQDSINSIKI
jgi:cellulose synthase/poly-beta-1,6-N-acetylglucosamine synthase-like glycosyltransferase